MTNSLFDSFKESMLGGGTFGGTPVNFMVDTIMAKLVDTSIYDPNPVFDESLADLSPDPTVGVDQELSGISVNNGLLDANNLVWENLEGEIVRKVLLYKDTGTPNTSPLILVYDDMPNLPITPNGDDVVLRWNAAGLFSI